MKNLFGTSRSLWLLAAVLILTGVIFAQATDSVLVGIVTDASGAAVANGAVTATNKETNVKYATTTNAAGEYRLNNVPIGTYDVSATAKGFATSTTAGVELTLNRTVSVNLSLAVGTVSTTVDVTEASALLDTSSAQVQTNFNAKQNVDIPLASLTKFLGTSGIYNLAFTGAGVASSGGVGQGTGPSVSGQRPENNSFSLDGVDNNDRYVTGPAIIVSNEAIAQMNVLQNQFSPEFGGASGGVFNAIVKSGTNSVHGSIYEYFQNRNLNAMDATNVEAGQTSLPRFDQNRIGATVGGPIIKNKLFYFGNYEYQPTGQAASPGQTVYAPTAAGLSLLNGMSGLSKTNLGIFEKYVPVAATATNDAPTSVNGVNIPTGPLTFASPAFTNGYNAVVAIDYNMGEKDQIRGRYFYSNSTGIDTNAALPVFYVGAPSRNYAGNFSEFHNFSPTLENELRVSYHRFLQSNSGGNFTFPGLSAFPNLTYDDLNLQVGPDPNTPTGEIAGNLGIQDNLTKTWGKHTFKVGYQFSDTILTGTFVQRARGDYDYVNLEQYLKDMSPTGTAFGTPGSGERSAGANNGVPFGFLQNSFFANDDFRIRPNLTLNLGVRYEYVTEPVGSRAQGLNAIANVPGIITFNTPHYSKNDWSPKIGFAYSPGKSGVWTIRGGVSRAFDLTYINLNQNASPPYYQTTLNVPETSVPGFLAGGGLVPAVITGTPTAAQARAATASYTFSDQRPYALTGTMGVQRLLAKDYVLEARYVYTKGVHLWNQTQVNQIDKVTPTNYIPTYFTNPGAGAFAGLKTTLGGIQALPNNYLLPYGFTQKLTGYHPWGNSRYNGLQMQVTKRYSKNLSYVVAYTWSHAFDDSTATNFSSILSPRRAQDLQNMRAEWASSALDRRHRFTITPVYDFKPFQNGSWLMKNVVGNWNISGTYTYQSPEYATVQSGVDSNLNGDALDRSITNPAGQANLGTGVTGYNAAGQPVAAGSANIVAYVANSSNARYVTAALGALSNTGRNTFPLAPINNWDFALVKRFNITERFRFDIGAQAFNLFNHAQFVGSFINDSTPFSTAAISRNFLVPSNPQFGAYNQATASEGYFGSNARTMQLTAHFTF